MKLLSACLSVLLGGATPAAASILTGPMEMPEVSYGSVSKCERALFAMVKAEMAKPQTPNREVKVSDGKLVIQIFISPTTSYRIFRCRGSFLAEVRSSVAPSPLPPPPPLKP